jgi:predicted component of type VI protein secretion system
VRFEFNARPTAPTPTVELTPTATPMVEAETPLPLATRRVLILDEPGETQALASFFGRFTHRYTYDVETASTVAETAAAPSPTSSCSTRG